MFAVFLVHGQANVARRESHASPEVLQLSGTGIGGHNDDAVAEIHEPSVAVGQPALVKHLQQQVEHVAVSLLYLVEQHDAVGLAPDALRQLATLLVAHIARRGADETADIERLGIF